MFLHLKSCLLLMKVKTIWQSIWQRREVVMWPMTLLYLFYNAYILQQSSWIVLSEGSPGTFVMLVVVVVLLLRNFFNSRLHFYAIGTPLWLLRHVRVSSSSEFYPGYFSCLLFPGFSTAILYHFATCTTILSRRFVLARLTF